MATFNFEFEDIKPKASQGGYFDQAARPKAEEKAANAAVQSLKTSLSHLRGLRDREMNNVYDYKNAIEGCNIRIDTYDNEIEQLEKAIKILSEFS